MRDEYIRLNLGLFDKAVRTMARVRAAEQEITLKEYIKRLIVADATAAQAAREVSK